MQGLCLLCGQWLCRKPFLTQLRLLSAKHPARSCWCGEQENRACWVKSRCFLPRRPFRLIASGVSDGSHLLLSRLYTQMLDSPLTLNTCICFANWTTAPFSECHRPIWGFLWTGVARSTIHLFIRRLSCFEKQFERGKMAYPMPFAFLIRP